MSHFYNQENWTGEQLAKQLGITVTELNACGWTIEKESGDDGNVYNYYIRFSQETPADILQKIAGLDADNRVLVKANYEDDTF